MTDLFAARSQMAMSLAFHIVFAAVGIAMPWFMAFAEAAYLRTHDPAWKELAKRWAKGTAIFFAVGAVSGTVLSFELGLLWPTFMLHAGPLMGMPFSMEGFAFFLEAIFLGIYLYGWDRVPPRLHVLAGVMVGVCGVASAMFVICANSWMNRPVGFVLEEGRIVAVDPWRAMFNPGAFSQGVHMVTAAFLAVAFVVAAIHARRMLRGERDNRFHRHAFGMALAIGTVSALVQPMSGHSLGQEVAVHQPVKLAAMEAHWETQRGAPFLVGGWPDEQDEVTRWAIEIPMLMSFLAFGDLDAEVVGLRDVPPEDRPPVRVVHVAFQLMIASGLVLIGVGLLGAALAVRGRGLPDHPAYLRLVVAVGPLGFVGIFAGWTVTEVGRQPWIVYGVMRTSEAVTPVPGLAVPFAVFTAVYLGLSAVTAALLRRQIAMSPSFPRQEP